MGYEMLTAWGAGQESKKRKIYEERLEAIKYGKKNLLANKINVESTLKRLLEFSLFAFMIRIIIIITK